MKCKIFGLLVLWIALLPLVVLAQVQPTSGVIPFSGSIPDQPDGPVALRFRLFPVASGGAQCFEETQTVQVTTQTFSVFIGDATTGGIPPSPCFTDNTSLWVAFALDEAPDTEIGARASIPSSGYAHFALGVTDNAVTTTTIQDSAVTLAKIAAGSVDGTKIVDGSIGASHVDSTQVQRRVIGSCDVGNAIRVINDAGTVDCQPTGGGGGIGGSGTANFISKFTAPTTLGDSAISEVGGNVGIGTTNPGTRLDVAGAVTGTQYDIGGARVVGTPGIDNLFVGVSAGASNTTGSNNAFFGSGAGPFNTTGSNNAFFGSGAGTRNTTGRENAFFGSSAGPSNTTGIEHAFFGFEAGRDDTSFCCNAFFGAFAGRRNIEGIGNSFFGTSAGQNNTTGSQNAFFGLNAGGGNRTGSSNAFFGAAAGLANTTGEENTAIGFQALFGAGDMTGNGNTAVGFEALWRNGSGRFNTASGHSALLSAINGFFNTAIGADALRNTTSGGNTAVGWSSLVSNTTGFNNTAIGFNTDVEFGNLTNATAIGAGARVNASNKVRIGNAVVTRIEGQVPFSAVSDKTKKENFLPLDGEEVLKKIGHIPVHSWNFIGHDPKQFRHYGPNAQDFFAAFGDDGLGTIGTPTTITSGDMDGILMIAVQALEKRTAENAELKARIEALERLVKGTQTARSEATE